MMGTTETAELRKQLEALAAKTDEEWKKDISPRKLDELHFHDQWRDREAPNSEDRDPTGDFDYDNEKYYVAVKASRDYTRQWIERESPGKVVLDYACGNGNNTRRAAKAGAALAIGIDLSLISVQNAGEIARREGLGNTVFLQADCEDTGFPDNSVDVVICSGMLHHLDLSYAFFEMRRIMKPGGVCLCIEALNYNPAIRLYRYLTRDLRTDFERKHILTLKDVEFAKRFFTLRSIRYWHLCSIMTVPFRKTRFFPALLRMADSMDLVLLRICPLSLMAWMFTFELVKPKEE